MRWAIRYARESDNIASDFTIYSLNPSYDKRDGRKLRPFYQERYSLFTPSQREAIIAFLRYTSDEEQCWFDNSQAEAGLQFWIGYHKERLAEESWTTRASAFTPFTPENI